MDKGEEGCPGPTRGVEQNKTLKINGPILRPRVRGISPVGEEKVYSGECGTGKTHRCKKSFLTFLFLLLSVFNVFQSRYF